MGIVPAHATSRAAASGCAAPIGHLAAAAPTYNGGSPPLVYQGGPVVGTPSTTGENTVHTVLWAPPGYAFPAGYAAGLGTYVADVAAASDTPGNVYSVATQYTASGHHMRYLVHDGGQVAAADAYPSGCTPDAGHGESYTACLTDSQLHAEVSRVLTASHLPTGMGDIYVVALPPGVETCVSSADSAAGGTCSDPGFPGFCAYHSGYTRSGAPVLYVNLPYPTQSVYSCLSGLAPNGSPALDSAVGMLSHEHNETMTDPWGTGWIDPAGNEDGDLCAWTYGPLSGSPSGARWNQVINGHHYALQEEFSNEDYALDPAAGCAASQAVPRAVASATTSSPTAGGPVAFSGAASSVANVPGGITSWAWSFGDGATGSGATPSHTYASEGTFTVGLTVTDTDGFSASTTVSVSVRSAPSGTAPTFTSGPPPTTATVGVPYAATVTASGSPAPTYALVGAPTWLSVDPATGVVTGTPPSGTTSFSFSVTATDGVAPDATAGPYAVTVAPAPAAPPAAHGYWLVGADGGIFTFGSAGFHGSTGSLALQRPVVGITPTADRSGYWLVAADGGIFAFGDAGFHGSIPGLGLAPAGTVGRPALAAPIVAMVPSTDGGGYFMVAADGGIFAFGDAHFAGSCPGIGGCAGRAVAVVPDASGDGYWLVTDGGTVTPFGDAPRLGSRSADASPVTSAVRTPDGAGYWILSADGSVQAFGSAAFHGAPVGAVGGLDPATAIVATSTGGGYWVTSALGACFPFGDAPDDGSMAGARLNAPVIAASGW
jgi:PKD repeat protein